MKLNLKLIKEDEKFSNHAIQGFSTEECPIGKSCFSIATGFGGAICNRCEFLVDRGEEAECTYEDSLGGA